jgi:hypothetical protein
VLFTFSCALIFVDTYAHTLLLEVISIFQMELGIPFVKTVTHQIFVIYLDQAKLEALDWCVGVMHWTDNMNCFSTKILSTGKTHTPKITYDIDYKSLEYCVLKCEV